MIADDRFCATCQAAIHWIECPTGGWWAHLVHPADNHDAEPTPFGHHVGRSWDGTRIEDECPCPQEPCGLVDPGRSVPECEHHPLTRCKSVRQGHAADLCPGGAS